MRKMAIAVLFLFTLVASSYTEEAVGVVTRIIDGVTFEASSLGCVRLADVMSVNANPHFTLPHFLEPCFLCGFIQQPLDLLSYLFGYYHIILRKK
jgi:hypothetical protein